MRAVRSPGEDCDWLIVSSDHPHHGPGAHQVQGDGLRGGCGQVQPRGRGRQGLGKSEVWSFFFDFFLVILFTWAGAGVNMRTGACSDLLPSHTLSSGLSGGAESSQSWKQEVIKIGPGDGTL